MVYLHDQGMLREKGYFPATPRMTTPTKFIETLHLPGTRTKNKEPARPNLIVLFYVSKRHAERPLKQGPVRCTNALGLIGEQPVTPNQPPNGIDSTSTWRKKTWLSMAKRVSFGRMMVCPILRKNVGKTGRGYNKEKAEEHMVATMPRFILVRST